MSKKILFVANTDIHIKLCYMPYMKYFKDNDYLVHVATNTGILFDYCDRKIELPICRSPYKFRNILAIFRLRKIIKAEEYDLIITSTPMGSVIARLASFNRCKLVYIAHGFHFFKGAPWVNYFLYYPIEKILMRFVSHLVVINEEDYKFAKGHFNIPISYIKGIGYNEERLRHKLSKYDAKSLRRRIMVNDSFCITYIAEISKRKRQEYLIKCLALIKENIKVLLVGNNILGNKIYKLIKRYHLEDSVKVLGFREDISDILDISDLVVSVSKQEGLPLNVMEAMYKNKPIIVTDCRGNRDLIKDNVNGVVVPLNDDDLLIKKILYLKSNRKYSNKIATNNQKIIEEYSIDNILPQYVAIYKSLLGDD